MDKILAEIKEIDGFPEMGKSTLRLWVKKLGFVCKMKSMKLKIYQRLDIVLSRQMYLWKIRELQSSGYKVFYQDETWCNANHTRKYIWRVDDDASNLIHEAGWKGGLDVPCGRG